MHACERFGVQLAGFRAGTRAMQAVCCTACAMCCTACAVCCTVRRAPGRTKPPGLAAQVRRPIDHGEALRQQRPRQAAEGLVRRVVAAARTHWRLSKRGRWIAAVAQTSQQCLSHECAELRPHGRHGIRRRCKTDGRAHDVVASAAAGTGVECVSAIGPKCDYSHPHARALGSILVVGRPSAAPDAKPRTHPHVTRRLPTTPQVAHV